MNDIPDQIVKPTRQRMKLAPGYDELSEAQAGGVLKKTGAVKVWTPLEDIFRKGRLTVEENEAGKNFYRDYVSGGLAGGYAAMRWSEYISGLGAPSNLDGVERRIFYYNRFQKACDLLREAGLFDIVKAICLEDYNAEDIGRRFKGYRTREKAQAWAIGKIETGLLILAKFYGLKK